LSKKKTEVTVLGHKFTVKTDNPEDFVSKVAIYVNEKLEEVKGHTKTATSLNVALMTCLNIAEEYLKFKEERGRMKGKVEERIQGLIEQIESQL
jgi:cell division protein ZapA